MPEKLNSHEVSGDGSANQTKWDSLKDVPMATKENNGENEKNQYETELTSPTDVLDDIKRYTIKDGKVYSKETGEEESDEDAILRIKTSRLLFNEAKARHDERASRRGNIERPPEFYVDQMLEEYGFKNENVKDPKGQMLKDLIENGSHHQTFWGDNLSKSKYSIFVGEKQDFGKALLERRLKQHGIEMIDMNIDVDTSTFRKGNYSTVEINIGTAPPTKSENTPDNSSAFHHPAAEQLEKLEAEIAKAEQNGDEDAANGYRSALRMVIERNPLEVSPEDWDKMSDADKDRFYKLKMKEAKVLGDKEAFNFWNANFKNHNQ